MQNSLYNKKHLKEYLIYGFLSAVLYIMPSYIFFLYSDYNETWIIFLGSVLFMFVIMIYGWKLAGRRPDYKSAWMMILASHFAILVGVILSVLLTAVLCFIYIPGFLSGNSPDIVQDSPAGLNIHNTSLVMMLFVCATVENVAAGGFMAVLGPYVFKRNQTKDKTALMEAKIEFTDP